MLYLGKMLFLIFCLTRCSSRGENAPGSIEKFVALGNSMARGLTPSRYAVAINDGLKNDRIFL